MCAVYSWFLKEQMLTFSIKIQLVVNWRRKRPLQDEALQGHVLAAAQDGPARGHPPA